MVEILEMIFFTIKRQWVSHGLENWIWSCHGIKGGKVTDNDALMTTVGLMRGYHPPIGRVNVTVTTKHYGKMK